MVFLNKKYLIYKFIKQDFVDKYVGHSLGMLWTFIQPISTIAILWFVFQVGLKSMPVNDFPFILWLIAGILPWFFIVDSFQSATNSIVEKSYLVKKIVFSVELLPIVKILAACLVHIFFIFFMLGMFVYYGYQPSIFWIQILYYLFSALIFLLAISWISSSLIIFFKDTGQIVNMLLQFGFWGTPIFWSYKLLPDKYMWIVEYNPVFYIIDGYRDSLINNIWFWNKLGIGIYFWSFTIILLGVSIMVFKKLRPHFSDLL